MGKRSYVSVEMWSVYSTAPVERASKISVSYIVFSLAQLDFHLFSLGFPLTSYFVLVMLSFVESPCSFKLLLME